MEATDGSHSQDKIVIRGLEISPPIALAPMVGLTHSALRSLILEEGGVGLLFTEMLAARRLPHDNENISPLLVRRPSERPLFYQLIASTEEHILPAVEKLERLDAQGIDLNLGCPAPHIKRQGAGASLAEDRLLLGRILATLRKYTSLPLSVKIRLGIQLDSRKLNEFCRFLEGEGVDLITIHARLNGEKFCRKPKWSVLSEVRGAVNVPIIANGGIFTVEDGRNCLRQSGADGLMIGRGAVENPWLCRDIAESIYGIQNDMPRTELFEIFEKFIRLLEDRFAQERRLGRLKQFTHYYAASFPFGHHLVTAVQTSKDLEQARDRARDFFKKEKSRD